MPPKSHHVFISYARKDNLPRGRSPGSITCFIQRLRNEYFDFTGGELRVFFDQEDIEGMDQWQHRILSDLSSSYIFLACVSPAYLQSEWCQREFNEYRKGEVRRGVAGAGVAPVYAFQVPEWSDGSKSQPASEWVLNLRNRQFFDMTCYFSSEEQGSGAVAKEFRRLLKRFKEQISRSERSEQSPGFVDPHNHRFVGRENEMEWLRRRLASPSSCADLVVLHGLGGMGKTSLAVEYAHNFAHEYLAGRWQAKCGRRKGLYEALAGLAPELGIEFHLNEPADWDYRAQRVLAELQKRAMEGVSGTPSRCLLILDNADDASLLALSRRRVLPWAGWLHVIVTSQFGPSDAPDIEQDAWLAVDRLPGEDAFRILEQFQAGGSFFEPVAEQLARKISAYLGGFTMALECAGIFLARFPGDGPRLLEEIELEGLAGFEAVADRLNQNLFLHDERRLTATLGPILERLEPDELLTLQLAAVMPADSVIWEWIEYLVGDQFPEVERAEQLGEVGRWTAIQERLHDLRLVTGSSESWAGRIHSLVQEVIASSYGFQGGKLRKRLIDLSFRRCSAIEHDSENRAGDWELEALRRWAVHLMELDPSGGGSLEARLAGLLRQRGRYREEEPLRRHVVRVLEKLKGQNDLETTRAASELGWTLVCVGRYAEAVNLLNSALSNFDRQLGDDHPDSLLCVSALAAALRYLGDFDAAEPLYLRAAEDSARLLGLNHPRTLTALDNLAILLQTQRKFRTAEPFCRRALEGYERTLGPDHPDTLTSLNNLAVVLFGQGSYRDAEAICRRALKGRERALGPDHPQTLTSVDNLATALREQGNYGEAEALCRRALEGYERILGQDHPDTLMAITNLGHGLRSQGRDDDAAALYRRALEGFTKTLGPNHPYTGFVAGCLCDSA